MLEKTYQPAAIETRVHSDLFSVGGSTVPDTTLAFRVTPARALAVARAAGAKRLGIAARRLNVTAPRKLAYDPALVGDAGGVSARCGAWWSPALAARPRGRTCSSTRTTPR